MCYSLSEIRLANGWDFCKATHLPEIPSVPFAPECRGIGNKHPPLRVCSLFQVCTARWRSWRRRSAGERCRGGEAEGWLHPWNFRLPQLSSNTAGLESTICHSGTAKFKPCGSRQGLGDPSPAPVCLPTGRWCSCQPVLALLGSNNWEELGCWLQGGCHRAASRLQHICFPSWHIRKRALWMKARVLGRNLITLLSLFCFFN